VSVVLTIIGYCWSALGLANMADAVVSLGEDSPDFIAFRIGVSLAVFVIPGLYCLLYGQYKEAVRKQAAGDPWSRRGPMSHPRRRKTQRGGKHAG
jgi:hypothetical protein